MTTQIDELFAEADSATLRPRKRRRRWPWIVLAIVLFVILGAVAAAGIYLSSLARSYDEKVVTLPQASVFPAEESRPAALQTTAQNILLLGSDSRAEVGQDVSTIRGQRADTIMLLHIPADRQSVQVMSIMRDNWVSIPGYGDAKINAALAFGGTPLLVQTIESMLGTRIDHVAIIGFDGFKGLTDALGGVTVNNPVAFSNNQSTFAEGEITLNGDQALDWARARYPFEDGDYTRVKNQQLFLKGVINQVFARETLTNPATIADVVSSFAPFLTVDAGLDSGYIASLAPSLTGLRPEHINFFTAPTLGTDTTAGGESIVVPDWNGLGEIGEALRNDTLGQYLAERGM